MGKAATVRHPETRNRSKFNILKLLQLLQVRAGTESNPFLKHLCSFLVPRSVRMIDTEAEQLHLFRISRVTQKAFIDCLLCVKPYLMGVGAGEVGDLCHYCSSMPC